MSSFNVSVSGLEAASTDMDTISNNLANAATTGFKRSRAEFADLIPVGSGGNTQVGLGVRTAQIRQLFTQGNLQTTENTLDLAVDGAGFFMLSDEGSISYTRNGAFGVDKNSFLVDWQGQRVQGFQPNEDGLIINELGDLQISQANLAPRSTERVRLEFNLDVETPNIDPAAATFDRQDPSSFSWSTSMSTFDSLGFSHLTSFYFAKRTTDPAGNMWDGYVFLDDQQLTPNDQPVRFTFDNNGQVQDIVWAGDAEPGDGNLITVADVDPQTGAAPMTFTMDFRHATQYSENFSVLSLEQDGFAAGELTDLTVGSDGILTGRYSNGQARVQGQIAMADFPNLNGLQQVGDTSWAETTASGQPLIGTAGSGGLGLLATSTLEASNVDTTAELVAMIEAQRNFEANAEAISTADQMTQAILNIR